MNLLSEIDKNFNIISYIDYWNNSRAMHNLRHAQFAPFVIVKIAITFLQVIKIIFIGMTHQVLFKTSILYFVQ